jgi:hypothetical protein
LLRGQRLARVVLGFGSMSSADLSYEPDTRRQALPTPALAAAGTLLEALEDEVNNALVDEAVARPSRPRWWRGRLYRAPPRSRA